MQFSELPLEDRLRLEEERDRIVRSKAWLAHVQEHKDAQLIFKDESASQKDALKEDIGQKAPTIKDVQMGCACGKVSFKVEDDEVKKTYDMGTGTQTVTQKPAYGQETSDGTSYAGREEQKKEGKPYGR